jgi:hypothetical protein
MRRSGQALSGRQAQDPALADRPLFSGRGDPMMIEPNIQRFG